MCPRTSARQQPAPLGSSSGGGGRRRSHRCHRRHCHTALLLALVSTLAVPTAVAASRAAVHDCPQYTGTILDMPDTTDCRRLLSKLSSAGCLPDYHHAVVQVRC